MIRGNEKSITQDKGTEGKAAQSCSKSHMGRRGGVGGPEEEDAPVVLLGLETFC